MRNLHPKLSPRFVLVAAGISVLAAPAAAQAREDTLHMRNLDTGNQVIRDGRGGIAAIGTGEKYATTFVAGNSGLWVAAASPGLPTFSVITTPTPDEFITGNSLVATQQLDGFIAVGSRRAGGGLMDTVVMRINSAGSIDWSQVLRFGNEDSQAQHVVQCTNDRYAIVGTSGTDLLAFLIDGNGTVLQSVTVGGPSYENGKSIGVDPATGAIVAVGSSDDLTGQVDMFTVSFDANLNYLSSNRTKTPGSNILAGVDIIPGAGGAHTLLAADQDQSSGYLFFTSGIVPTSAVQVSSPLRDFKPASMLRLPTGAIRICGKTDIRAASVIADAAGTVTSGRQYQSDAGLNSIAVHPNGTNLVMVGRIPVGTNLTDAYFVTSGLIGGTCASRGFVVGSNPADSFTTAYGSSSAVTHQVVGSPTLTSRGRFSSICP